MSQFEKKKKEMLILWGEDMAATLTESVKQMEEICGNDERTRIQILNALNKGGLEFNQAVQIFFGATPSPEPNVANSNNNNNNDNNNNNNNNSSKESSVESSASSNYGLKRVKNNRKRKFNDFEVPNSKRRKLNSSSKSKSKSKSKSVEKSDNDNDDDDDDDDDLDMNNNNNNNNNNDNDTDAEDNENSGDINNQNNNNNNDNDSDNNNKNNNNRRRRHRRRVASNNNNNNNNNDSKYNSLSCYLCFGNEFDDAGGCVVCQYCTEKEPFCKDCIIKHFSDGGDTCPYCEQQVTIDDYINYDTYHNAGRLSNNNNNNNNLDDDEDDDDIFEPPASVHRIVRSKAQANKTDDEEYEQDDEEDEEEDDDINIVNNSRHKPSPRRRKVNHPRRRVNQNNNNNNDDSSENENKSEESDESDESNEEEKYIEPELPDREWQRRKLSDYSFRVKLKDNSFYKRDLRCVGSIASAIKTGHMEVIIEEKELQARIDNEARLIQAKKDVENDMKFEEKKDENNNNNDNVVNRRRNGINNNNNAVNPVKTPLLHIQEYNREIGTLLEELSGCLSSAYMIAWVKSSQIGNYDKSNPNHNTLLKFDENLRNKFDKKKKNRRNNNNDNNNNNNDSNDDEDSDNELNAKLSELNIGNEMSVIYRINVTIFVNKSCHEKDNVSCVTFMKHVGGDKIRGASSKILDLPKQYRDCGHTMTLTSLLDFACRHRLEPSELISNIDDRKYKLRVDLREYQKQAVHWMIREEKHPIGFYRHLFIEGKFPDGKSFYYSPAFQMFYFDKLPIAHGGLLCEEMGLGKTIETLALINANQRENWIRGQKKTINNKSFYISKGTLIIAPVSLVGQWEEEILKRSRRKMTVARYHGTRKKYQNNPTMLADHDVVLTTYGILGKENGEKQDKHRLHQIEWHRIVLDESHTIKAKNTCQSKNINSLTGINKWLLTGTPFNTNLSDMHNQLSFIALAKPVESKRWWDDKQKSFQSNSSDKDMVPLFHILKSLVMRHKKKQSFNNEPIVSLPPKNEDIIEVEFTPIQRKNYEKLLATAINKYKMYCNQGTVGRNTLSLLQSLLPARRVCSGYTYLQSEIDEKYNEAKENKDIAVAQRKSNQAKQLASAAQRSHATEEAFNADDDQCNICFEEFDQPMQTPCRHIFCQACIESWLEENHACPFCRKSCVTDDLKKPPKSKEQLAKEKEKEQLKHDEALKLAENSGNLSDKIVFDAKIQKLLQELKKLRREKPNEKILIFTTFSECLDWICNQLKSNGFTYRTLKGSMTMNKRKKALQEFQNDPPTTVFVLTVRAGAVGITLTAANHVFLMEPPLNPALGKQAVNRVYRLGQDKPVHIHTLVMKDSIESRIVELHKDKETESSKIAGNIGRDTNRDFKENQITKLFDGLTMPNV